MNVGNCGIAAFVAERVRQRSVECYSHLAVVPLATWWICLLAMRREMMASDVLEATLGMTHRCWTARVQAWVGSSFLIAALGVSVWLFVVTVAVEPVFAVCLLLDVGSLGSDCQSSSGVPLGHRYLKMLAWCARGQGGIARHTFLE